MIRKKDTGPFVAMAVVSAAACGAVYWWRRRPHSSLPIQDSAGLASRPCQVVVVESSGEPNNGIFFVCPLVIPYILGYNIDDVAVIASMDPYYHRAGDKLFSLVAGNFSRDFQQYVRQIRQRSLFTLPPTGLPSCEVRVVAGHADSGGYIHNFTPDAVGSSPIPMQPTTRLHIQNSCCGTARLQEVFGITGNPRSATNQLKNMDVAFDSTLTFTSRVVESDVVARPSPGVDLRYDGMGHLYCDTLLMSVAKAIVMSESADEVQGRYKEYYEGIDTSWANHGSVGRVWKPHAWGSLDKFAMWAFANRRIRFEARNWGVMNKTWIPTAERAYSKEYVERFVKELMQRLPYDAQIEEHKANAKQEAEDDGEEFDDEYWYDYVDTRLGEESHGCNRLIISKLLRTFHPWSRVFTPELQLVASKAENLELMVVAVWRDLLGDVEEDGDDGDEMPPIRVGRTGDPTTSV